MKAPAGLEGRNGTPGTPGALASAGIYLREMYPPLPRLVFATLWFMALYLGLASLHDEAVSLLAPVPVVGVLTYFFFNLFLRVSDELKDLEADRTHFPERSIPSGAVSLRSVHGLWFLSLAAMILLQIPVGGWSPAFVALIAYGLLMYRYFFLRRWIAASLLLALVTHNPVAFLMQLYGIWLFSESTGHAPLQPLHLALAVLFWLPVLTWELSRKIRAPEDETAYQTYSGIFGARAAAAIAAVPAVAFAVITFAVATPVGLGAIGRVGIALAAIWFVWKCLRFAWSPTPERARLGASSEGWAAASLLFWSLDLVAAHRGSWTIAIF